MSGNKRKSAIIAAAAAVSLTACSSAGQQTQSAGSSSPAVKPTLKVLGIWQQDDYNTYPVAKMLEEKTGYKVQYDMLPQDKPEEKLNLLIASNEAYDLVTTGSGATFNSIYFSFASQGALTDLTPLIDKYAPNVKSLVSQESLDAFKVNGKLYAIPNRATDVVRNGIMVRTDWLEKLGMKAPSNLDEFVAMLKAFKEKDPGGNGDKNIPMTVRSDAPFIDNLVGAFGMANGWNDVGGKLIPRVLDPAFKDYVTFVGGLFKDGLLDKEFPVNKDATVKEKFASGRAGAVPLGWSDVPAVSDALLKNNPNAKIAYIPALKGATGKYGHSLTVGFDRVSYIPKSAKNPEEAMKWINAKLEKETFKNLSIGEEGKHYTFKDGKYEPILPIFTTERNNANNYQTGVDEKLYPEYWQARVRKDPRLYEAWAFLNVNQPKDTQIKDVIGSIPYSPDYTKYAQQLYVMANDYTIKLIAGAEPASGIEAFIQKFNAAGGEASVKEVNAWYSARKK
ncbi:extracellular solute-binding protein [Paenibacillus cymbidii]|uniref:extracellular solute-binding protein n=1 Tax=Paenibacillus cymbidii TaxID=1639034 RepID=UPI00108077D9|nr:extracellular solute-binding protein [Paenibacillus cymbidii]